MLSEDRNRLLTRVEPGQPMHEVLSSYWIPAGLSSDIAGPDSDPVRVVLLGKAFVLFRDSEGVAALLDEACPHRGASLALGRVEQGGIRCIYHGWKFDREGTLVEAPNVADGRVLGRICQPTYPLREAGGLVWAYIGPSDRQPPFPHHPFFDVPEERRHIFRVMVNANFVQVAEGTIDSSHLGVLHSDGHSAGMKDEEGRPLVGNISNQFIEAKAPRVEVEAMPWGFRYAALRDVQADDGSEVTEARITTFHMPFCSSVSGAFNCFMQVPVTSGQTVHYHIYYDLEGTAASKARLDAIIAFHGFDRACALRGDPRDGADPAFLRQPVPQDRAAMREGSSFGGLNGNVVLEDVAVIESMGPVVDRTVEHLVPADAAVAALRRLLLDNVRKKEAGEPLSGVDLEEVPVGAEYVLSRGANWREAARHGA